MYSVRTPNSVESLTISPTSSRVAAAHGSLRLERDDSRRSSLFTNGVHEQADLAAGPEPGNEAVAGGRILDWQAEFKHARGSSKVAAEREVERLVAGILAQEHDLVALEQIGQPAGDELPRAPSGRARADRQLRVGQDRTVKTLKDCAHLHLDILAWQHERGGRSALVGDLLQERRIDVHSDAEREDPPLVRVALTCQLADRGFRGLPDCRQTVGHE